MPMLDSHRFAHLTPDERIRRIGDLIGKAVMIFRQGERAAGRLTAEGTFLVVPIRDSAELVADAGEKRILRHLQRAGSASPHDFCIALDLPCTTLMRKLARLRAAELVAVTGKTKAARYSLKCPTAPN